MIVKRIIVFITYILIFSAMFYGNMPTNREKPFSEIVEISEYQGVKLGSSEDFQRKLHRRSAENRFLSSTL